MRKYYIDNLRIAIILLLFVYHTFLIFNNFNYDYYVNGQPNFIMSIFIIFTYPWFMPILFTAAGISTKYALLKRSPSEYIKERFSKLLVPFLAGTIFVVPFIAYYGQKFHNGFNGSFFEACRIFFTDYSDITSVDGGFTPAHLWFVIYLFIISTAALPVILFFKKHNPNDSGRNEKITVPVILSTFVIIALSNFIFRIIQDKSIAEYFIYFILGYFIFSEDSIIEKIKKQIIPLSAAYVLGNIIYFYVMYKLNISSEPVIVIIRSFLSISGIMLLLGYGEKYLNFSNKITQYFSSNSFQIYIVHQSWLIASAYYLLKYDINIWAKAIIIIVFSLVTTVITCEALKRVPFLRCLFAVRK